MANSILKLKVESSEYDAKLKKAAEGVRHLADVAHQSAGDMTGLDKSTLDYIKSIGEMETKSRTAAGSVRELESTYKELKVIYDQLNDVEKADEGGKALAASLEQIKQRAQEAKAQLDTASKSLNDNGQSAQQSGGILESLAGKFTLNIDALKLFDMGLSATKAALDVAKEAFFASEANVDEWGRTVAASQSLYEGFLTAINNGDISGYLSNIDSIVKAARLAYDELDKLGTMKTIQAPQISKQQTENERIRMMIQTGRYIAPQDGRSNTIFNGRVMQNGDKLTAGQIRAMEKQLAGGMQNVTTLVGNEVKQTGKAIDAYYNKIAKTNGMTLQEFKKGTSSWEEFSKKMEGYDQYKEWDRQARAEFAKQGGRGFVDFDKNNPYAEFKKWGTFRVDKEGDNSYKELVGLIQQRDQQIGQMYSTQAQAYRTMNRAEGVTVRKIMGDTGGKGGKTTKEDVKYADDSIMAQEKLISDLTQKWKTASGELRDGYLKQLDEAKAKLKEMTAVDNTPAFTMAELESTSQQSIDLRGNNGKAQDNADIALAKFATSGTSNVDFSSYTSALQNAIKDANVGSEIYTQLSEQLSDSSQVSQLLQQYIANGITGANLGQTTQELKDKLMSGEIDDATMQTYVDQLNEQLKAKFSEEEWPNVLITFDADTKKIVNAAQQQQKEAQEMAKDWRAAGSAIQAVGAAMNQIEDPAAKVLGTIAQAVATMAMSYAQAAASQEVTGTGWGWIAFAATGLATMLTSINAIKQATAGFAGGGIYDGPSGFVPGNKYSGDLIPANGGTVSLSSGELILNRAQQGVIAQELEGGAQQGGVPQVRLEGEEIWIALNNYTSRTGYGEILTSRA